MTSSRTHAIGYARLSQEREESDSIAGQRASIHAYCQREGLELLGVLADESLSGGLVRDKAMRALEMLRTGEADVLVVTRSDRWSRQGSRAIADLEDVLDEVQHRPEARFVAIGDGFDSRQDTFDTVFGITAVIARAERRVISRRMKESIERKRADGRWTGGTTPFGYCSTPRPNGAGRVLVLDESEAAEVRDAATRVLAGTPLYAVAADWTRRGVVPRRGGRWTVTSTRNVLVNEMLLGRWRQPGRQETETRADGRRVKVHHHGDFYRDIEGIPIAVWPPLLDTDTFYRLAAKLGADLPTTRRANGRANGRLLSGLVTCHHCEARLRVTVGVRGEKRYFSYTCPTPAAGGEGLCPGSSVSVTMLEEHLTDRYLGDVGDVEVLERVNREGGAASTADVDAAVAAILAEMGADDADVGKLALRLEQLKACRAELRAQREPRTTEMLPTGETYGQRWKYSGLSERRAMLADHWLIIQLQKATTADRGRRTLDPARLVTVSRPISLIA